MKTAATAITRRLVPMSALVPVEGEAEELLVEDIEVEGLRRPLLVEEDGPLFRILDGRRRYLALVALGVRLVEVEVI